MICIYIYANWCRKKEMGEGRKLGVGDCLLKTKLFANN